LVVVITEWSEFQKLKPESMPLAIEAAMVLCQQSETTVLPER